MIRRRVEQFEARTVLQCGICGKDIEVGEHYCLNDTGEPMHYFCYDVLMRRREEEKEEQGDRAE